MITRLKIKFICINMLIVTVMLTVIFGMVLHNTSRNMEEEGYRTIQSIHQDPLRKGPSLRGRPSAYFTVTVSSQGSMYITASDFFDREIDGELLEIARGVYDGDLRQGVLKEHSLRFLRRTVPDGEEIVFLDISMEDAILEDLIKTCVEIALLSYLLFFAVSVLLAQWAIKPVETAWNHQRQFVADASHELKTPLTVIMTNAELLQDADYEDASRNQFVSSILAMSHQMRGLVEGLLDLTRVDNGVVKTSFSEVDFSNLVENCLLPFDPLFFERGMELFSEVESEIILRGSQSHLRQVVDILLDNAVKYGDPGKRVELRLQRQGRFAQLCVSSAGDEIFREDLKRIFRRFYRIDKARSMNQSYGLGLSIAQAIVTDHKGKIWAESKNGFNSFYVQLPILPYRHSV